MSDIYLKGQYHREYMRKWRIKNPKYNAIRMKQWREDNPEKNRQITRKSRLKTQYNMSTDEYNDMLEAQKFCCAICETNTPGGTGCFHVDHNHKTKQTRALLCSRCNTAIGLMKEDITVLHKAIEYLNKYSERSVYGSAQDQ